MKKIFVSFLYLIFILSFVSCNSHKQSSKRTYAVSHNKPKNPFSIEFVDKDTLKFLTPSTNKSFSLEVLLTHGSDKEIIYTQNLTLSEVVDFDLPSNYEEYTYIIATVTNNSGPQPTTVVTNYKINEQEEIDAARKAIQK